MSAICGKVSTGAALSRMVREYIRTMCSALQHRASAAECLQMTDRAALACKGRRTAGVGSVIGQAPRSNGQSVCAVCDGEIYNADALRRELQERGQSFSTEDHAELIAHLYESSDDQWPARLRGAFAFAVWDEKNQRLLLGRDRIGQKPLSYAQLSDGLVFASGPQAVAAHPQVSRDIDVEALDDYLRFGYIPWPRTIFAGVKKLPPAHILVAENGQIRVEPYWRMGFDNIAEASEDEAAEELLARLRRATRKRMADLDHPAVLLSGGVDSSLVVALASEVSSQPLLTFSIGFEEADFDERQHARRVAEKYGTDHHEHVVGPDIADTFPKLARYYGEPYADSSAIVTFELCRFARQHVPAVLLGDGGDDLFAGYGRYALCLGQRPAHRHPLLSLPLAFGRLPSALVAPSMRLASALVSPLADGSEKLHKLRDSIEYVPKTLVQRHWRHVCRIRHDEERLWLLSDDLRAVLADRDPWPEYRKKSSIGDPNVAPLNQLLSADLVTYLPDDLCVKTDVAGTGNDLVLRAPILDDSVVEFALCLRPDLKVKNGITKYLLKRIARQFVPAENLDRRKQGFGVPVGAWLRGPLRDMCCDLLLRSQAAERGLLNGTAVGQLVREHTDGVRNHSERLWQLLMLELWLRECADGSAVSVSKSAG